MNDFIMAPFTRLPLSHLMFVCRQRRRRRKSEWHYYCERDGEGGREGGVRPDWIHFGYISFAFKGSMYFHPPPRCSFAKVTFQSRASIYSHLRLASFCHLDFLLPLQFTSLFKCHRSSFRNNNSLVISTDIHWNDMLMCRRRKDRTKLKLKFQDHLRRV